MVWCASQLPACQRGGDALERDEELVALHAAQLVAQVPRRSVGRWGEVTKIDGDCLFVAC